MTVPQSDILQPVFCSSPGVLTSSYHLSDNLPQGQGISGIGSWERSWQETDGILKRMRDDSLYKVVGQLKKTHKEQRPQRFKKKKKNVGS